MKQYSKGLIVLSLIAFSSFSAGSLALAHDGPHKGKKEHQQQRLERLSDDLSLTNSQKDQLKTILVSQKEKMKSLHEEFRAKKEKATNDTKKDALRDDFRDERKALAQETDRKIVALLNAEQKVKYEKIKEKREEKKEEWKKNKDKK